MILIIQTDLTPKWLEKGMDLNMDRMGNDQIKALLRIVFESGFYSNVFQSQNRRKKVNTQSFCITLLITINVTYIESDLN